MTFTQSLLKWYHQHGRHDLPWQSNMTPYRIWISEIMLQQTQVNTVIPYYEKFMQRFPSLEILANAKQDDVLLHWSGLGYYSRARNLHKTAQIIHSDYQGKFPQSIAGLSELPGIGRSTAGAILSFSMQITATILDGNVKRVLTRFFAIEGWYGKAVIQKQLWALATQLTPDNDAHHYNQAIMDLGATICTRSRPACDACPVASQCQAKALQRQKDFPTSKPKKTKRPKKQTLLLILENAQAEILLIKRPSSGIWGGLWCFIDCDLDADLAQTCQQQAACDIIDMIDLPSFTHQFTHFSLDIHPKRVRVKPLTNGFAEPTEQVWYQKNTALPGGIPTPIKKLLTQLGALL